jgi:hypothetical protein
MQHRFTPEQVEELFKRKVIRDEECNILRGEVDRLKRELETVLRQSVDVQSDSLKDREQGSG